MINCNKKIFFKSNNLYSFNFLLIGLLINSSSTNNNFSKDGNSLTIKPRQLSMILLIELQFKVYYINTKHHIFLRHVL